MKTEREYDALIERASTGVANIIIFVLKWVVIGKLLKIGYGL